MDDSVFEQPTPDQLSAFVQGDPIAKDEVVSVMLPQLYRWARNAYQNLPEDEVQSTLHQVLAEICLNYSRYDPERAKFTTYVIHLFRMRLASLHQLIKSIGKNQEINESEYENRSNVPYNKSEADIHKQIAKDRFFDAVTAQLDGAELEFLRQMRSGEKDLAIYVSILSLYQAVTDPASEVKNTKERLKRKIKAIAEELGYQTDDLIGE